MADAAKYIGMSGAQIALQSLGKISNNLANANTPGFKADYHSVKSMATQAPSLMQTRIYNAVNLPYSDFKPGPLIQTDNDLDIAINGPGFIAVQTQSGQEAYTRAGNLQIGQDGLLTTAKGEFVLGLQGLINIPSASKLNITETGLVSAQLQGQSENQITELGKIKLVDIPANQLVKGQDGLFYLKEEGNLPQASTVKLQPRSLEGSNVDPIRSLTEIIDISRQFEMQTHTMKTMQDNSTQVNQLLDVS